MKTNQEYLGADESWTKFSANIGHLLTVSHEELLRREAEYRKQVEANPKRRGPKRKRTATGK